MKILTILIVFVVFSAGTVFADSFSPTQLKLSAPEFVHYNFDGDPLSLPLTVSGTAGTLVFGLFTKNMAEVVAPVRNGYLGWHYVSKVDTCIYISGQTSLSLGENTIAWDGKDNDGNFVPAGEYTYHFFAVDTVSQPLKCIPVINMYYNGAGFIEEYQPDGTPYPMPVWTNYPDEVTVDSVKYRLRKKWLIGSDPDNPGLMETCYYDNTETDIFYIAWAPDNHDFFFQGGFSGTTTGIIRKWGWTANGEASLASGWGNNGTFEYAVNEKDATWTIDTDGEQYLFALNQGYHKTHPYSEIILIDAEKAEEVKRLDLQEYYVRQEDKDRGGWLNGGPTSAMFRNGYLFTNCHHSCVHLMIDPYEESDDFIRWSNENGDYVLDHNFSEDSQRPWVCNEPKVQQIIVDYEADDNFWTVATIYDTSFAKDTFGLLAPDGTGVGNFMLTGETGGRKLGSMIIDSGSAYDGICFTQSEVDFTFEGDLFWIGHDSIQGIVGTNMSVEQDTPAGVTVGQNSPNPFNPATTISFTLAQAKNITIDVFTTAGQKIETLCNGFKEAGFHAVEWNGSGYSSGVYFYRLEAGNFSRTMKMTLVK